jgi:hypothetical protein
VALHWLVVALVYWSMIQLGSLVYYWLGLGGFSDLVT